MDDTLEPCAGCAGRSLDRRSFVSESLLAAAALALAACGESATEPAPPPPASGTRVDLNGQAALNTVGGVAVMTVAAYRIAVIRTGQSSYTVLSRICPHQGGTIELNGSQFRCSRHGATFDKSGNWTGGQRTTNMRTLNTSYDPATNTITIL